MIFWCRYCKDGCIYPFSLFFGNFIGCPSATIYRRKINKLFDTKLKYTVDLDFYIRVLNENPNFIFCPEPLVCVTEDAPHQVTRECAGIKNIEVFEWIYLYNKISQDQNFNYDRLHFIFELLKKHNITTSEELVELGIEPPISKSINGLILLNKIVSEMRVFIGRTKNFIKRRKYK